MVASSPSPVHAIAETACIFAQTLMHRLQRIHLLLSRIRTLEDISSSSRSSFGIVGSLVKSYLYNRFWNSQLLQRRQSRQFLSCFARIAANASFLRRITSSVCVSIFMPSLTRVREAFTISPSASTIHTPESSTSTTPFK